MRYADVERVKTGPLVTPHSKSRLYRCGAWFVLVNHVTRQCQIIDGLLGDMWHNISRAEAVTFMVDRSTKALAA